jgi:peptidoglycan glycosyltransferase
VRGDAYADDSRNSRVLLRTYEQERGPISVLDGTEQTPIARSEDTGGRLRYLRQYAAGPRTRTSPASCPWSTARRRAWSGPRTTCSRRRRPAVRRRLSDYVTGREPSGGSVLLTHRPGRAGGGVEGLAGKRGAVVALDPRTGAVLAMVSAPSFDPEPASSHDAGRHPRLLRRAHQRPGQPLLNRAISQTYPPGSTFKVVTAAAALESGASRATPDPVARASSTCRRPARTCATSAARLLRRDLDAGRGAADLLQHRVRLARAAPARERAARAGAGVRLRRGRPQRPDPGRASRTPEETNPPQAAQSAIGQFDVRATPAADGHGRRRHRQRRRGHAALPGREVAGARPDPARAARARRAVAGDVAGDAPSSRPR